MGGSSISVDPNSGLIINGTDISIDHDHGAVLGYSDRVGDSGNWSNGTRWDGYYTYPTGHLTFYNSNAGAYIDFDVQGQTCLINNLRRTSGGYVDVYGIEQPAF